MKGLRGLLGRVFGLGGTPEEARDTLLLVTPSAVSFYRQVGRLAQGSACGEAVDRFAKAAELEDRVGRAAADAAGTSVTSRVTGYTVELSNDSLAADSQRRVQTAREQAQEMLDRLCPGGRPAPPKRPKRTLIEF